MGTFDNSPGSNFCFFFLLSAQSHGPRPTVFARNKKREREWGNDRLDKAKKKIKSGCGHNHTHTCNQWVVLENSHY
jgi:hypothetical protein